MIADPSHTLARLNLRQGDILSKYVLDMYATSYTLDVAVQPVYLCCYVMCMYLLPTSTLL